LRTRLVTCSCNRTIPIDGDALDEGLRASGLPTERVLAADRLCRSELAKLPALLDGIDDLLVGCTQEARLFDEVARGKGAVAPVRFVNLREQAGWGAQGDRATPKIAALVALSAGLHGEPTPAVDFRSEGRLLIVGGAAALRWAARLQGPLSPTVLLEDLEGVSLADARAFPVVSGALRRLDGWLGTFEATWEQSNPIDLEACVRCGACVEACPEGAIGPAFQVDAEACRSHRACVAACGAAGAIVFARAERTRTQRFDLVMDLRARPAFTRHAPPQGYFHPGPDPDRQADCAMALAQWVGEFEKPRYVRYKASICAHSRNRIDACSRCIDVCSAEAIVADGDGVRIEPHLCVGCGACATVCPTGAASHAVPGPALLGDAIRRSLDAYRGAGGRDPVLLVHAERDGAALIASLGRAAGPSVAAGGPAPAIAGLPARVIPVPIHHVAAFGLDLVLASIAYGAAQVATLFTGEEAPQYVEALREQHAIANALLEALAPGGPRAQVVDARDALELESALAALQPATAVGAPARFAMPAEKRRAIETALDHLVAQARAAGRAVPAAVPLAAGAAFGAVRVDTAACTLCLACTSACPAGALVDDPASPRLRFIERNCVQCGLCAKTCPEDAIVLEPRMLLDAASAAEPRELARTEPFGCVRCGAPFGTRRMVDAMVARLSAHAMFGGDAARRLQMCADCRVVDQFEPTASVSIHDVGRGGRRP
jgi:MinD superfamily P-loop ATPase